jgi:hypothetical protein
MKRLTLVLGLLALGAVVAPVYAQTPSATKPKPVTIGMYVDTVSSSRGDVKQSRVCTQTNYFPRRSRVVFRMWAVDAKSNEAITAIDVKYAYVKIPGQPNLKLNWGAHGATGNKVNFWSAAWAIPADYPMGVVPFQVVLKTTDNRFGTYKQPAVDGSQLTVTP